MSNWKNLQRGCLWKYFVMTGSLMSYVRMWRMLSLLIRRTMLSKEFYGDMQKKDANRAVKLTAIFLNGLEAYSSYNRHYSVYPEIEKSAWLVMIRHACARIRTILKTVGYNVHHRGGCGWVRVATSSSRKSEKTDSKNGKKPKSRNSFFQIWEL